MVIFYFEKQYTSFLILIWGILIIPFMIFIYIAISTGIYWADGKEEDCFLVSKIWLMTDCIVFAFLVPEFIYFMTSLKKYMNFKKNVITALSQSLTGSIIRLEDGKKQDEEDKEED
jgi:hypothetical protein